MPEECKLIFNIKWTAFWLWTDNIYRQWIQSPSGDTELTPFWHWTNGQCIRWSARRRLTQTFRDETLFWSSADEITLKQLVCLSWSNEKLNSVYDIRAIWEMEGKKWIHCKEKYFNPLPWETGWSIPEWNLWENSAIMWVDSMSLDTWNHIKEFKCQKVRTSLHFLEMVC